MITGWDVASNEWSYNELRLIVSITWHKYSYVYVCTGGSQDREGRTCMCTWEHRKWIQGPSWPLQRKWWTATDVSWYAQLITHPEGPHKDLWWGPWWWGDDRCPRNVEQRVTNWPPNHNFLGNLNGWILGCWCIHLHRPIPDNGHSSLGRVRYNYYDILSTWTMDCANIHRRFLPINHNQQTLSRRYLSRQPSHHQQSAQKRTINSTRIPRAWCWNRTNLGTIDDKATEQVSFGYLLKLETEKGQTWR